MSPAFSFSWKKILFSQYANNFSFQYLPNFEVSVDLSIGNLKNLKYTTETYV